MEDIEDAILELPDCDIREIMVAAGSKEVCNLWALNFLSAGVGKRILVDKHKDDKGRPKIKNGVRSLAAM